MKKIAFIVCFLITVIIYRVWFSSSVLTGGDFWYVFPGMYENRPLYPYAWDFSGNNGMGGFSAPLLWVNMTYAVPITFFGTILNMPWVIIERISFFLPFIFLSFFSAYLLAKKLFDNTPQAILSGFFYTTNSYILMIVGGGQLVGFGLSYAVFPFVVVCAIAVLEVLSGNKRSAILQKSILLSLALALVVLFDIRMGYVSGFFLFFYFFFNFLITENKKKILHTIPPLIISPLLLTFFLHAFWLLPLTFVKVPTRETFEALQNTTAQIDFFSFATFENAFSLMHPNWPENIFGKITFMKPEFLVLPFILFSSLLYTINHFDKKQKYYYFFLLLILLGAFLAKGTHEPLGNVYLWLFQTIPGFWMFRDPTKWYVFIALGYALLLPQAIFILSPVLSRLKFNNQTRTFLLTTVLLGVWLFTVREAFLFELRGTFTAHQVPQSYLQFEKYISTQSDYFRTLWLPQTQRFGYYSPLHPQVSAGDFFHEHRLDVLLQIVQNKRESIESATIKYIIVPYDTEGEIFLKDRKYDSVQYHKTISTLDKISWLQRINNFESLAVYEVATPQQYIQTTTQGQVTWSKKSPVQYEVALTSDSPQTLLFSESYDPNWVAIANNKEVHSGKYLDAINSFAIPQDTKQITLFYKPQEWMDRGAILSLASLLSVGFFLIFSKRSRKV